MEVSSTRTSIVSRGYVAAITATVLWSFSGILISYLTSIFALPPLVLAFWSVLFVALGMFAGLMLFSRERFRLERSQWKFMILYGLTFAVFHYTWTLSVQYNGAAVATFLVYSSPIMTAILSSMLFQERFNRVKLLSIALSLAGTVLMSGAYDPSVWKLNLFGILFGLLSGPFFAFYNLEGKHISNHSIDPWTAVLYCFTFAAAFLLLFNVGMEALSGKPLLSDMLWLGDSASGWGLLLLLGIGPTLGGFGFYTLSLRYLTPTVANLIATLEPAFTAVWAFLLLHEYFTLIQWVGSVLILGSVVLLRWSEREE